MRVLILYDEPRAGAREDELDALVQADAVAVALAELGHASERLGLSLDLARASAELCAAAPDVVFNLVESLGGDGRLIAVAPALCESLGLAYAGNEAQAVFCTSNKLLAKRLMRFRGLPTPESWTREQLERRGARLLRGTFVVKSVWEHASIGLDEDSVVECQRADALSAELARRLPSLGGSGFAEAYVDGREFNLSLLADVDGARVLAPAEIDFQGYGAEKRRVVGYRAKWDPASFEYHHTPRRFAFPASDRALLDELATLARAAWEHFGLRGWARVDFRVDAAGRPWILEVNTNPCLSPDAGFAAALAEEGLTLADALARILADTPRAASSDRTTKAKTHDPPCSASDRSATTRCS